MIDADLIASLRARVSELELELLLSRADVKGVERLQERLLEKYKLLKLEHAALIAREYPTVITHEIQSSTDDQSHETL